MSVIKAENVTKTYNETKVPVHALNGINLEVAEGEFTAIVGPSGCGKTTLLNILGGLDHPTEGNVEVANTNIGEMSDGKLIDFRLQNIGFVFQAYNLIPVLTNKENVEFIMLLQKQDKKTRDDRAMDLLTQMGIADKADQRPSELSGGQQQRIAIARALINEPKIIMCDEPTGNLDSKNSEIVLDIFKQISKDFNQTIITVTHDNDFAKASDRVIEMQDGEIINHNLKF